jgi:manganese transport system ATP-binding protein
VRVTPAAVVARDLVLAYGPRVAIDRSSFVVPRGGITALIGPNGSGKSTLLAAVAGLIEPASGTIEVPRVDGVEQRVSFVLQSTKVNETLPVTVREVVTMGRYAPPAPTAAWPPVIGRWWRHRWSEWESPISASAT